VTSSAGNTSTRGRGRVKLWSAVSTAIFSIALIAAMLPTAASAVGTVPPAPTGVTAVAGNATVTASWTASVGNGGSAITGYTATASPGGATCTDGTAPYSCSMAGLNGTAYTVTVQAENANGFSVASAPSSPVTPGTFPSIPGTPTVAGTGTPNEVLVSWTASASLGGGSFTGYTVTSNPVGSTCTTTGAASCTVTGLTAVSHTFTVHATNSLGSSGESAASPSIIATGLPGAPTFVSATPGDGQLTLVWTAPTNTGGSSLIGYDITADNGSASATAGASDTSAVLTGLVNGTIYTVTIKAKNASGSGTADTIGGIPAGAPDIVTGVTAAPNGTTKELLVTWVVPASLSGRTFVKYEATADSGETCSPLVAGRTNTSCIITVAANGVNHTVSVHVVTSGPVNGPESVSSTPAAAGLLPVTLGIAGFTAAPTGVSGEVLVSWTPATLVTGVLPVLGYKVTAATSTNTCTATTASSCTVTGQTDGTPDNFTVLSQNAAGWAGASPTAIAGTSSTVPTAAPTALSTAAVTATTASIGWTPVPTAGNGGATIHNYVMTSTPASTWTPLTATTGSTASTASAISVTGLSTGTTYTFTVHAVNDRGNSVESAAITVTPTATPGAPTLALTNPISGDVDLTVTPPAVLGGTGSTPATYALTITPAVAGFTAAMTSGANTTVANTGLADGTSYTYSVVATNNGVAGPAATITQVAGALLAPPAAGGVVGAMLVPLAGGASVRAQNWVAVTGATGYTVKAFSDAGRTVAAGTACSSSSTLLECVVTGLSPSTQYFFSIFTNNAVGSSATPLVLDSGGTATLQATTLATVPGAPTGVTATSGANGISVVSWTTPLYSGGAGTVTYSVTALEDGTTTPLAAQTLASGAAAGYVGLTNGKSYTFTVKTVNSSSGTSAASAASAAATPANYPQAPTNVTGVVGDGQVVVSWDAPLNTGGVPIDAYGVGIATPPGLTEQCTTTGATSCTITGLANGIAYTFAVAAHNATATGNGGGGPATAGWSANSALSASLTPAAVSGAPSGASATAGNGSATVTWTAPSSDGDSTLILYTATASPGGATCLQISDRACQRHLLYLQYHGNQRRWRQWSFGLEHGSPASCCRCPRHLCRSQLQ